MSKPEDPRLTATRNQALDAAQSILQDEGVLAVTHASVSARTGISRSTLYRHWPEIGQMRNDAFKRAATPPRIDPPTDGPLRADLMWMLSILMAALNETPWGQIAPQVIAAAATDQEARAVINGFMEERIASVETIFAAAEARGELSPGVPVAYLVQMAIAVPYFRKLIAGLPLDQDWLKTHVDLICSLAAGPIAR
jgi:AcrR family transcriptional regulator